MVKSILGTLFGGTCLFHFFFSRPKLRLPFICLRLKSEATVPQFLYRTSRIIRRSTRFVFDWAISRDLVDGSLRRLVPAAVTLVRADRTLDAHVALGLQVVRFVLEC